MRSRSYDDTIVQPRHGLVHEIEPARKRGVGVGDLSVVEDPCVGVEALLEPVSSDQRSRRGTVKI